ncbi:hypothetical protein N7448_009336 [Penicillium atrosanguineum]|uniref:Uncharacterized protein n=1 Tax=Penicillium atrosanguineum TaxID=1132637 RepID=A0A9W9GKV5_9EURO|nr:uncharacterized protein N7443_006587 [Penicillium atrosanguineum]KAJ5123239.1 hypothetical protein N7448_009336 [Penicillium atrosanguineum]KAJ5298467.1 hypothetical protein N7443_006587 [Penicillium atrosanguineum]KAJ5321268.1 hypothetical protein N7476_004270 [Penicillium atrosanguineum]
MGNKTTLDGPRQAEATRAKNEALDKLIQVYHVAKADYYLGDANKSGISDKSTDKFTNVRFLRDTAENLLRCLKAQGEDHHLIPEVERVVTASCEHAERLAGGRKRIFEDPEDEQLARHRNGQRHNQENKLSLYPSHPSSTSHGTRFELSKRPRTFQPVDRYRGEAYKEDWHNGRAYERTERIGRGHSRARPFRDHYRRGHPAVRDRGRSRTDPADYAVNIEHARDTRRSDRDDRTNHGDLINRTEPFDRPDEGYNGSD